MQSPKSANQKMKARTDEGVGKILSPLIPQTGMSPNAATAMLSESFSMSAPNWKIPGSSPNAFAISLGLDMSHRPDARAQLFEYPATMGQLSPSLNAPAAMYEGQDDSFCAYDSSFVSAPIQVENILGNGKASGAAIDALFSPLNTNECSDRQLSHRESERRRRKSLKTSMDVLEALVLITVNRTGNSPVNQKGRNKGIASKRLSHAEIYQLAREMIRALKAETAFIRSENLWLMSGKPRRNDESL